MPEEPEVYVHLQGKAPDNLPDASRLFPETSISFQEQLKWCLFQEENPGLQE